jgi:tRNA(Ile)-lysidine synthase
VPADVQGPVTADEAAGAFAFLRKYRRLILAVSGGPDSLALLLLFAEWRRGLSGEAPHVNVATVDHGLRAEAASEAAFVASVASKLSLPHATLTWSGEKPKTGIADAAREARYRVLRSYAETFDDRDTAVLTAHHLEDQAETLAMRLARGAGITGLAGMRRERPIASGSPIVLARPLLAFSKARLVATVEAGGFTPVDDPTNHDESHERVRVRRALHRLADAGIEPAALAKSAMRLGAACDALDYAQRTFTRSLALSYGHEVFASLSRDAFAAGPAYLRQAVLAKLIDRYGGATRPPRLSEIEALVTTIEEDEKVMATLGGAVVSAGKVTVKVWRESGRLEADVLLSPGESSRWDERFIVACAKDSSRGVSVRPLGERGYLEIASHIRSSSGLPSRAAHALPAFWRGSELLAVPALVPFGDSGFSRWATPMFEVRPIFREDN